MVEEGGVLGAEVGEEAEGAVEGEGGLVGRLRSQSQSQSQLALEKRTGSSSRGFGHTSKHSPAGLPRTFA